MLTPYYECKELLLVYFGESRTNNLVSSAVAGIFASCFSLPFDNMKTKLQRMKMDQHGNFPYKGIFDCCWKTLKNEGPFKFWVGLPTFYFRVAPHAMITLLVSDYLKTQLIAK